MTKKNMHLLTLEREISYNGEPYLFIEDFFATQIIDIAKELVVLL